jgi:hypothetical protein
MAKVKDLTYSENQKKQPLKDIILPSGAIQKVPFGKWKQVITTNPFGKTAMRARINNDPDLEKIKLPVIELAGGDHGPIVFKSRKGTIEQPRPTPNSS